MAEWGSYWATGYAYDPFDDSGSPDGVSVTASATPNTKGSWTACVASTPVAAGGLLFHFGPSTAGVPRSVDIGIAPSGGSEQVVFPDFVFGSNTRVPVGLYLPGHVAASSRVSVRLASTTGSATSRVYMTLITPSPFAMPSQGQIAYLGPTPASAGTYGTTITPSNGTFSTWVQLSASTPFDAKAIMVHTHSGDDTAPTAATFQWQLGVGAINVEVVIVDKVVAFAGGAADVEGPGPSVWMPCHIPAGQRVSARALDTGSGDNWQLGCWILG